MRDKQYMKWRMKLIQGNLNDLEIHYAELSDITKEVYPEISERYGVFTAIVHILQKCTDQCYNEWQLNQNKGEKDDTT